MYFLFGIARGSENANWKWICEHGLIQPTVVPRSTQHCRHRQGSEHKCEIWHGWSWRGKADLGQVLFPGQAGVPCGCCSTPGEHSASLSRLEESFTTVCVIRATQLLPCSLPGHGTLVGLVQMGAGEWCPAHGFLSVSLRPASPCWKQPCQGSRNAWCLRTEDVQQGNLVAVTAEKLLASLCYETVQKPPHKRGKGACLIYVCAQIF